jgi:hypothetical protein
MIEIDTKRKENQLPFSLNKTKTKKRRRNKIFDSFLSKTLNC